MSTECTAPSLVSRRLSARALLATVSILTLGQALFFSTATVLASAAANPASSAAQPILYQIDLRDRSRRLVRVTMTVPHTQPGIEIQFPAWNALYQIRDFIKDVQGLEASCDGQPAELTAVDVNTYRNAPQPCSEFAVYYAVHAAGFAPFSSGLNEDHAFLNPATVLFYVPRERARPIRVQLTVPEGWRIATPLEDGASPGEYVADNYDTLADSPIEAGTFQEYSYSQGEATYRVVVDAEPSSYSSKLLLESLQKITATETSLMGEAPLTRYTFIFHFGRGGGGGMEHKYGTAISIPGAGLHNNMSGLEDVAAHEFFHLWNVKRIRPQGLEPIDYVHGNDTSDLWFSEGVDSTYTELVLLRAGLISHSDFYQRLASQIRALQDRPARSSQSASQSSREAWLEKYPEYSRPERSISYYNKGELLGFLLDLGIRQASRNAHSLDDVLRRLNNEYAHHGRFFTDADLKRIIAELAPSFGGSGASGVDSFFQDYVNGTRELPYAQYLAYAGLRLATRSVERSDPGFQASRAFGGGAIAVLTVEQGSEAAKAGLKSGDILLSLNGKPLTESPEFRVASVSPEFRVASMKPGESVKFEVRRGAQTLNLEFHLGSRQETEYRLEEDANAIAEQKQLRKGWLEGKTEPVEAGDGPRP